jgi:hypothetical protein
VAPASTRAQRAGSHVRVVSNTEHALTFHLEK